MHSKTNLERGYSCGYVGDAGEVVEKLSTETRGAEEAIVVDVAYRPNLPPLPSVLLSD